MNKKGFTMLELIIAVALMVMVMMAVVNISSIGVRYQLQSSRKGQVNGAAISAMQEITKRVEGASYIVTPAQGATADYFEVCQDWASTKLGPFSPTSGATIDGAANATVYAFCIDNTAAGTLYEYTGTTGNCNTLTAIAANCTPPAGLTQTVLVPGLSVTNPPSNTAGVWRMQSGPATGFYFRATQPNAYGDNGIEAHINFGDPIKFNDSPNHPAVLTPQVYSVETKFNMQKSFNNQGG